MTDTLTAFFTERGLGYPEIDEIISRETIYTDCSDFDNFKKSMEEINQVLDTHGMKLVIFEDDVYCDCEYTVLVLDKFLAERINSSWEGDFFHLSVKIQLTEDNSYIMGIFIRNSRPDDYKAIEAIKGQVQQMHVDWRPDIYKYSETVLPLEVYEQAVESQTFFVAEYEGCVAGILFIAYHHIENPNQVTRDIIFVDSMAVDEKYRGKGIGPAFIPFYVTLYRKFCRMQGLTMQDYWRMNFMKWLASHIRSREKESQ